jgi:hypothetical protein
MAFNNVMTVIFATLTAISFARAINVKADGSITSFFGSDEGYQNVLWDFNDPKPSDSTDGDPKNAAVLDF